MASYHFGRLSSDPLHPSRNWPVTGARDLAQHPGVATPLQTSERHAPVSDVLAQAEEDVSFPLAVGCVAVGAVVQRNGLLQKRPGRKQWNDSHAGYLAPRDRL